MRLCWLLAVVLGAGRSSPSSGERHGCSRSALVPCPNVTGDILRFKLFQDQRPICSYTFGLEEEEEAPPPEPRCNHSHVTPQRSEEGTLAGFRVTASSSWETYRCEATVTYPPPLKSVQSDLLMLVLVDGHQCGGSQGGPGGAEDEPGRSQRTLWVWITAVALLSTYSLAITVLAGVHWVKLRRTELQSDYMNTRPRVQRAPNRKKKGIQNPPPRHF